MNKPVIAAVWLLIVIVLSLSIYSKAYRQGFTEAVLSAQPRSEGQGYVITYSDGSSHYYE